MEKPIQQDDIGVRVQEERFRLNDVLNPVGHAGRGVGIIMSATGRCRTSGGCDSRVSLDLPPLGPMPRSDISSLSDDSQSTTSSYDEEEYLLAQKEWEESLEQLQQLVGIVLLPFIGKWLGRRWSHTLYGRYLRLGLGSAFFFGEAKARPTRS